jgi:microcystin degradation protein MlrC
LIDGSCFAASPAGTINRTGSETTRDEILTQVKAAAPLDGVLLVHGYDRS